MDEETHQKMERIRIRESTLMDGILERSVKGILNGYKSEQQEMQTIKEKYLDLWSKLNEN